MNNADFSKEMIIFHFEKSAVKKHVYVKIFKDFF